MATTHRAILVKDKPLDEIIAVSKDHLRSAKFRIDESLNELIGTRGLGFITAQQRFILKFSQRDSQTVEIQGEFFALTLYFIKNTVAEKAVMGAIPRRTGYRLMMQYISRINGQVS